MKRQIVFWAVSMLALVVHLEAATVLLTDDFNDGTLDVSKWTHISETGSGLNATPGSTLVETGGAMVITQAASNAGGAYRTALLPVNDQGLITLSRRTRVHYANTYVSMPENLVTESGTVLLTWGYYNYSYGGTERFGFGGPYGTRVTGVWDIWFDEVITYDPLTGEGSYSLNGGTPVSISGTAIAVGTSQVYLQGGAYGWYTGHSKEFDSFSVNQVEALSDQVRLTISSTQGEPAPSAGTHLYTIGSSVSLSVESPVTSGGVRYACTGWTGTGSVPTSGSTNQVEVTLNEDSAITWNWEALDVVLTINSPVGTTVPSAGDHIYPVGTVLSCTAEEAISVDARHYVSGWTGTGSVPASGSTNQVEVTLNEDSTINWNWLSEYKLDILLDGEGTVNASTDFYPEGTIHTLLAMPAAGWRFENWSGDASGAGAVTLSMNGPKSLTAHFMRPLAVSNISAAQVEGSRTVEIRYDMVGEGQMLVDLEVYQEADKLNATSLTGALGMVAAGTGNVITWDAGADWNYRVDDLTFQLLAEDGLPLSLPYSLDAPSLVPQTGQTNDYGYAETDGALRPGLKWPEPRFVNHGDGTVTDTLTGLMWGTSGSMQAWTTAMQFCDNTTLGGHSDWRLPNVRELRSLFSDFSRVNPVSQLNMTSANYWTSTILEYSRSYAFAINSTNGGQYPLLIYQTLNYYPYTTQYFSAYYIPVRDTSTGIARVAKTGQVNSHYSLTTEDGDLQLGEAWPDPRFTDHGDGTVTDNLTGLMWTKVTESPRPWASALSTCAAMATGGHNDWRLPSLLELESLIDFGQKNPAPMLPSGHPFTGVSVLANEIYFYWSSTTYPGSSSSAYKVSFNDGRSSYYSKANSGLFMACRGGRDVQESFNYSASAVAALPATGQTTSYHAGDAGDLQIGTEAPSPRFQLLSTFHFKDLQTGLEWLRTPASTESYNWSNSLVYAQNFPYVATGWRMPNLRELESLVAYGETNPALPPDIPFQNVASGTYWSSTTYAGDTAMAYVLNLDAGTFGLKLKSEATQTLLVRAVSSVVAKTGQTLSYWTGDDGYYASGNFGKAVTDRFIDHGNGLVSDKLTGLTWFKEPSRIAAAPMTWVAALDTCNAIDFAGFDDWRLPNANELKSMIDYGRWNDALPSGHPFVNLKTDFGGYYYWSSNTEASNSNLAIIIELASGGVGAFDKHMGGLICYLWPVRGGN